jgi:hypothetical protein
VLVGAAPPPVLALHNPGLVRMQLQPHLAHPFHEGGQHPMGLGLADSVHHRVVHVALEPDSRELPCHPQVERIVQEQIGEDG